MADGLSLFHIRYGKEIRAREKANPPQLDNHGTPFIGVTINIKHRQSDNQNNLRVTLSWKH